MPAPAKMTLHRLPIPEYAAELVILHGQASAMAAMANELPAATFRDFQAAPDEVIYGATSDVCAGDGHVRRVVFVFIDSQQTQAEKRLTIVHELFHAVVRFMGDIGHDITIKSDEAPAYLLEWAVKETSKVCGLR